MMGSTTKIMALVLVALVLGDAAMAIKQGKNFNLNKDRETMVQRFEVGREYHFRYDAQTSTGYSSLEITRQRAINRLQALVKIVFQSPTEAVLSMRQVRTAQLSEVPAVDAWNPARLQPISAFENRVLPTEQDEQSEEMRNFNSQLSLPVKFQYTEDGMIESIRFQKSESTATKNIKKAVLNLIQLNLRPIVKEELELSEKTENKNKLSSRRSGSEEELIENWVGNTYTNVENTIEGQCETTYVVSPNSWEMKDRRSQQKWNVTKSINFERCGILADVAYGFQVEPTLRLRNWKQEDITTLEKDLLNKQRFGQVIPKEQLERSTVLRYVLAAPQKEENERSVAQDIKKFGIERVELLSEYTVQNSKLHSNEAMHTVAVAELKFLKNVENVEKNLNEDSSEEIDRKSLNDEEDLEETLIYNADFESLEKKFMMFGDEKYPKDSKLPVSRLFIFDKTNKDVAEQGEKMIKIAERQLDAAVRSFVSNEDENAEGINAPETAENLWNLVYIMRICTVNGLRTLYKRSTAAIKSDKSVEVARELFVDALALAGTRNSIALLTEMIEERVIEESKASQVLKTLGSGAGLPAISESQVDLVLKLCKSKTLESESLKRSCWLTFGTMVGELSQQSEKAKNLYETNTPVRALELATAHKMDLYKQVLLDGLKKADSTEDSYAKIIALKAIGNAGLSSTIEQVMTIVQNAQVPHDIRLHAIDALRRIVNRQPESQRQLEAVTKVQFGLLPVFQNVYERSDIRMATAAMLLTNAVTINTPTKHALIDQIVYAIQNDKNEDVVRFVSQILEGLSKSPIYEHQKIAQHLKNSLAMVKFSHKTIKQILKGSQYNRNVLPCCYESRVRSFLNFMNIYASDRSDAQHYSAESKTNTKLIPSQMAIELDSFVNGQYQRNSLQMNVIQNNFDAVLKELLSIINVNKYDFENMNEEELKTKKSGFLSNAAEQINSLFRKLNIKDRNDNTNERDTKKAYAFITLRNNDVDVVVEPITIEDILSILKIKSSTGNFQKLRTSFAHVIRRFSTGYTGSNGAMRFNAVIPLDTKFARIPTSLGMPLKICRGALIFGSMKLKNEQDQEENTILAIQPNFNYVEQQYMRVWMAPSAGVSAGVSWYRAAELNLPLEVELKSVRAENNNENNERDTQFVFNFRLPQKDTRFFGLHTLPSIFISWKSSKQVESNENTNIHFKKSFDQVDACIETSVIDVPIYNEQLSQQQREIDQTILKTEKINLPFRIHGVYHYPREWTWAEISRITKSSENNIHIDFTPVVSETPREIRFTVTSNMYQSLSKNNRKDQTLNQPWSSIRTRLEDFYGQFENTFFSQNNKKQFLNSEEEEIKDMKKTQELTDEDKNYGDALKLTHQYLEKNLAKSVSYKHSVRVVVETVGASRPLKADAEFNAVCDSKFRVCESRVEIIRSPLLAEERQQWAMELHMQSIYPETILNVQELESATSAQKRHLKLFANVQARWGISTEKKSLKINILGEPSEEMIRRAIDLENKHQLRLRDAQRREESESRIQQIELERPMMPFIDQFHAAVEYQLGAFEQNFVRRCIELLKTKYFWNTKCELTSVPYSQTQTQLLKATLRVDSLTRQYANLSLETPEQRILIKSLEMPFIYHLDLVSARRESSILRQSFSHPMTRLFSNIRRADERETQDENQKECIVGKENKKAEQKTIQTFDGVKYTSPLSKCYTILAKDCTKVDRQPAYAVLAKQYGNGNQKTIKVMSNYGTFEIEPTSENSKNLQVLYNGKTYNMASATAEDMEELDRHGLSLNEDNDQQRVIVVIPSVLSLEFNGNYVHIRLSSEFKNTQCGLCGHYDDKLEDEFRMNNNELTTDIKKFHRSFAVQDDSECSQKDLEKFYNTEKFSLQTEKKQKSKQMKFSKIAKKQISKSAEESMPVEQTVVYEYNQKMCFSLKPVAQCPVGWYSADLSGEQDLLKRTKVQFACVERSSIEAKRLKKIVRHVGSVDMSDYAPSYSELMVLPERCIQY